MYVVDVDVDAVGKVGNEGLGRRFTLSRYYDPVTYMTLNT
jgi:hypothetical protein